MHSGLIYLFAERLGRPGKGNDKGNVEGLVGFARRNFLVPVPQMDSFAALNAHLEASCRARQKARVRGQKETIAERLDRDNTAFLPLPASPYDACQKVATRVSSLALVRYRGNDYSVPVRYAHREELVRGYVKEVVVSCAAERIAEVGRSSNVVPIGKHGENTENQGSGGKSGSSKPLENMVRPPRFERGTFSSGG